MSYSVSMHFVAAELCVTLELDSTSNAAVVSRVARSSAMTPMLLTLDVVCLPFFHILLSSLWSTNSCLKWSQLV